MSRPSTPRAPGSQVPNPKNPTVRTRLLHQCTDLPPHEGPCNHGTFSPMPQPSPPGGTSPALGPSRLLGDRESIGSAGSGGVSGTNRWPLMGGGKTTQTLAERHGVKNPTLVYWMYYIPGLSWMGRYERSYLLGDMVAGGEYQLATA